MTTPLDSLNVSIVNQITNEQFVSTCSSNVAIPFLILVFLFMSIVGLILLLIVTTGSKSKGKIVGTWLGICVLTGVLITIIAFSPNTFSSFITNVKGIFGG